jgi:hypothetical protein
MSEETNNLSSRNLGIAALALLGVYFLFLKSPENKKNEPVVSASENNSFPWSMNPEDALSGPPVAVAVFDYKPPQEIESLPDSVINRYGWLFVPEKHWGPWQDATSARINPRTIVFFQKTEDGKIGLLEHKDELFHPVPQSPSFFP